MSMHGMPGHFLPYLSAASSTDLLLAAKWLLLWVCFRADSMTLCLCLPACLPVCRFVAKVRELRTNNNLLLLKCDMGAGHFRCDWGCCLLGHGRLQRLQCLWMTFFVQAN